jgi:hypothetical protein
VFCAAKCEYPKDLRNGQCHHAKAKIEEETTQTIDVYRTDNLVRTQRELSVTVQRQSGKGSK